MLEEHSFIRILSKSPCHAMIYKEFSEGKMALRTILTKRWYSDIEISMLLWDYVEKNILR